MYKAHFLNKIRNSKALKTEDSDVDLLIKETAFKKWNVYAKAPFRNPLAGVEYLGRYTHKIVITNHRIPNANENSVRFNCKDYADENITKEIQLSREEFLRRFERHSLLKRFVKIRYYGYFKTETTINGLMKLEHPFYWSLVKLW